MEETNKRLYPIEFLDNDIEMPWGRVCYHIADLGSVDSMVAAGWFGGNTLSELMGTYLERVVGDDSFEFYGLQFPVLVKEIKTTGWQPLQVNVGDEEAEVRYDSLGKKAFWYVKDASEGASLYLGLKREVDASGFYDRCLDGSIRDILNEVHPEKGSCFLIEPGTVFSAGPGLTILEIAECSELTFNLHGWGLPENGEPELEEAFDLIDFRKHSSPEVQGVNSVGKVLAKCDEFTVTKFELKDALHIFSDQPGAFAVYHCLSGEALVKVPSESGEPGDWKIRSGHTMLIPSEVNDYMIFPSKEGTVLLEATVERRTLPDSYTDGKPEEDAPDPHVRNWN